MDLNARLLLLLDEPAPPPTDVYVPSEFAIDLGLEVTTYALALQVETAELGAVVESEQLGVEAATTELELASITADLSIREAA